MSMSMFTSLRAQGVQGARLFDGLAATTMAKRTHIINRWSPFPQRKQPREDRDQRAYKSKKIVESVREAIEADEPSFQVGSRKIYFPSARVCLLRPNAKHTPYQAKFIVPKSFNKMDLRDYLWHIYGLRVLNVTSTLTPAKFDQALPGSYRTRFRSPQHKKMTVDLVDPFVWPAESDEFKAERDLVENLTTYREEKMNAAGSDKFKPTTAFGGILEPKPRAMNFVPKLLKRQMRNTKLRDLKEHKKEGMERLLGQYFDL